jgi:formylglycine-generating enzyme required for sulfatase activity
LRKVEEEVAWFDKYFFQAEKPASDAVKKDSPIHAALARVSAKRDNSGAYAEEVFIKLAGAHEISLGIKLPEVVQRREISIGRFEVTQAQYSQYQTLDCMAKAKESESSRCVEFQTRVNSTNNFPEAGITFQDAQAYVAWLSRMTKQTWRIPYEDEVKSLYENRDGENTLDYWAGYAPNPEDAAKLRESAKKLNGAAPLLKEVGSFHGQGRDDEEAIFDLGGNVAEWVLTRDGSGKVIGGSADCPADAKSNCRPGPEYVGFRVVRGEAKPAAPAEKH